MKMDCERPCAVNRVRMSGVGPTEGYVPGRASRRAPDLHPRDGVEEKRHRRWISTGRVAACEEVMLLTTRISGSHSVTA